MVYNQRSENTPGGTLLLVWTPLQAKLYCSTQDVLVPKVSVLVCCCHQGHKILLTIQAFVWPIHDERSLKMHTRQVHEIPLTGAKTCANSRTAGQPDGLSHTQTFCRERPYSLTGLVAFLARHADSTVRHPCKWILLLFLVFTPFRNAQTPVSDLLCLP